MPADEALGRVLQTLVADLYAEMAALQPRPEGWLLDKATWLSAILVKAVGEGGKADELREHLNDTMDTAESKLVELLRFRSGAAEPDDDEHDED